VDVLVALGVMGLVATCLAMGLDQQRRASVRLWAQREAVTKAEAAMADVRAGRATEADVSVTALSTAAPAGMRWVMVEASVQDQRTALTGLVKQEQK